MEHELNMYRSFSCNSRIVKAYHSPSVHSKFLKTVDLVFLITTRCTALLSSICIVALSTTAQEILFLTWSFVRLNSVRPGLVDATGYVTEPDEVPDLIAERGLVIGNSSL